MTGQRDCWSCGKRPTECMGQAGPRDIEMACWVPSLEEAALATRIPTGRELTGSARVERREPTAMEMHERARREFELHEAGRRAYQEPLERLAKEIDRQVERLLTERYPGTPIEAFVGSFIPGGLRIIAPDGEAFDFVYTTRGPSTTEGLTTMTLELTVTRAKGEKG